MSRVVVVVVVSGENESKKRERGKKRKKEKRFSAEKHKNIYCEGAKYKQTVAHKSPQREERNKKKNKI